jgi:hypothetical protein
MGRYATAVAVSDADLAVIERPDSDDASTSLEKNHKWNVPRRKNPFSWNCHPTSRSQTAAPSTVLQRLAVGSSHPASLRPLHQWLTRTWTRCVLTKGKSPKPKKPNNSNSGQEQRTACRVLACQPVFNAFMFPPFPPPIP